MERLQIPQELNQTTYIYILGYETLFLGDDECQPSGPEVNYLLELNMQMVVRVWSSDGTNLSRCFPNGVTDAENFVTLAFTIVCALCYSPTQRC